MDIINSEYNLKLQHPYRHRITEQINNNIAKNNSTAFPQDKINITGIAKHLIQSVDGRSVELAYSYQDKKVSAVIIDKDQTKIKVKSENLPTELKQINSPEVFSVFFKNTYAKISILSGGDYKLYVNHKLFGGGYESGSITPKTQGEAKFDFSDFSSYINKQEGRLGNSKQIFSDIKNLEQQQEEALEKILLINDKALEARRDLKELQHITDDNFIFELEYQEPVVQHMLMQQNDHLLVKRFGINPEAVKGAAGYGIAGDKLHYVEQKVFDAAFKELKLRTSTEASKNQIQAQNSQYLNNVTLVDIFERLNGIITGENSIPKTHTVVLWKKTDAEIVLIDPSKQSFSSFLKDILPSEGIKIELPHLPSKDGVLYGINNADYDNKGKIKKRDCIDIAVKIGFELNELQKELNDVNIIQNTAIKNLTNDLKINDSLNSVKKLALPFEDLQSSNKNVRRESLQLINDYSALKTSITNTLATLDKLDKNKLSEEQKATKDRFINLSKGLEAFEKAIENFQALKTLLDFSTTLANK